MSNLKPLIKEMVKDSKKRIKEEKSKRNFTYQPHYNISMEVDEYENGRFVRRLAWTNFQDILLSDIMEYSYKDDDMVDLKDAEFRSAIFMIKLKKYILSHEDTHQLDKLDWSEWDEEVKENCKKY